MADYLAYLIIRRIDTREEVHRIGLTHLGERHVDRVMAGVALKMDDDKYFIDSSEVAAARVQREVGNG